MYFFVYRCRIELDYRSICRARIAKTINYNLPLYIYPPSFGSNPYNILRSNSQHLRPARQVSFLGQRGIICPYYNRSEGSEICVRYPSLVNLNVAFLLRYAFFLSSASSRMQLL